MKTWRRTNNTKAHAQIRPTCRVCLGEKTEWQHVSFFIVLLSEESMGEDDSVTKGKKRNFEEEQRRKKKEDEKDKNKG